ncbi:hypothetical protein ABQF26_27560, partial [Mycolicibacterium elephantis]
MTLSVDGDDQGESARAGGPHTGLGVIDHNGALRIGADPSRSLQEHGGVGLARKPELVGEQA